MVEIEARVVEVTPLAHRRVDQGVVHPCVEGGVVKFADRDGAVVGIRGGFLLSLKV
jgi:hypothetical protein